MAGLNGEGNDGVLIRPILNVPISSNGSVRALSYADYQQAADLAPDNAAAWNNLGLAQVRLGRSSKALSAFRRALEVDPIFADAHYNATTNEYTYCGRASESFRLAFMLDNGGIPGNAVDARTVTPTRDYTGQIFNNLDIYRYHYDFPEPVDFGDAAWLRIACMPQSDGCGWMWSLDWLPEPPSMQV